ncbi:MAG: glycosyltransferase family 39 protein [Elusimicrobia bacterium]|nr:glycosyltransferase family 39 protein [Elusimicrobiota bacterium]
MKATRPVPPRSLLVLAACALLVLAFAPAQYFARQQDDALYLIGARALTSGRFCVLTSPGCPALTSVDPGWSLLLTPLALFTDRPVFFQIFAALLLALAPAALWCWLRRRTGETVALLAAALFASSPLVLAQSGVVMSEIPFVLIFLACLIAAESGEPAWTGGLGAALLLVRTSGFGALPGLLLPFALRRRPAEIVRSFVPPALAAAGWWAWCWVHSGTIGKFNLLPSTYSAHDLLKPFSVAAANAPYYLAELGGSFLPPSWAASAAAPVLGGVLAAVAAYGTVRALRARRDEPAAWALIGGALLLAVWGWQYERYLIPLLPLLLWALASGLGRAAAPVLAVLLAAQLGAQTVPRLGRPGPWAEPALARTYAWLAARPRPALLSSTQPVRDGWWAGLPDVALPLAGDASGFAAALKAERVSYVLRADGQDYGLQADPRARLRLDVERAYSQLDDARYFTKVHDEPGERAAVYVPR